MTKPKKRFQKIELFTFTENAKRKSTRKFIQSLKPITEVKIDLINRKIKAI